MFHNFVNTGENISQYNIDRWKSIVNSNKKKSRIENKILWNSCFNNKL